MSWHASRLSIFARNVLRKIGVTRLIRERIGPINYEESFDAALIGAIHRGDCVWDVGANIGYYTIKFYEATQAEGRVVAYEPSPVNRDRLEDAVAGRKGISIRSEALGSQLSQLTFSQGQDRLGATSRVDSFGGKTGDIIVSVKPGDMLIEHDGVPTPNVIKIDTEGFEWEVLLGLSRTLRSPHLHTVGVEVHFAMLAERGHASAPAEIEKLLRSAGLSTRWTDASHIVGQRARIAT